MARFPCFWIGSSSVKHNREMYPGPECNGLFAVLKLLWKCNCLSKMVGSRLSSWYAVGLRLRKLCQGGMMSWTPVRWMRSWLTNSCSWNSCLRCCRILSLWSKCSQTYKLHRLWSMTLQGLVWHIIRWQARSHRHIRYIALMNCSWDSSSWLKYRLPAINSRSIQPYTWDISC